MKLHQKWSKGIQKKLGSLFLAGALTIATLMTSVVPADAATVSKSVAGWVVYWDQSRGYSLVQNNKDVFDEMSPFWYDVTSTGDLTPLWNSENATMVSWAKSNGVKVIPLISNEFNGSIVSTIINNPTIKQSHINKIVNKVMTMGYDGIELDYENLVATDKDAFSAFVRDLGAALHQNGKLLVVTVHPKTEAIGTWGGPKAQDYVAIGQVADKVRIMAYDYHYSGGTPGSIAPSFWVDQVLAYSVTAIPKNKVVLGVPNYGYDWSTSTKGVTYEQAINNAKTYGALIIQDPIYGPHYTYYVSGVKHEVWFENTMSLNTKLDLVNKYDINGIAIWRLGGEDLTNYSAIRTKFPATTTTTTDTTSTGTTSGTTTTTTDTTSTGTTSGTTTTTTDTTSTGTTSGTTTTTDTTTGTTSGTTTTTDTTTGTTSGTTTTTTTDTTTGTTSGTTTTTDTTTGTTSGTTTTTPTADTVAPTLDFTTKVTRSSVTIDATATDNVKVEKVMFYIDGVLKYTDTTSAYSYSFKNRQSAKSHTVKVIAVDSSGNQTVLSKLATF